MDEITTMEEYFHRIDQKLEPSFDGRYPKLNDYYQELKEVFFEINETKNKNFFEKLKIVLSLDAQIQLLLEYQKLTESNYHEVSNEEDLISQIKMDSSSYYREKSGLKTSSEIPIGIMYLGENTQIY